MSEQDEPSKSARKRRRRSLRVPVDEVPRPTQASGSALEVREEIDGGATVEIPAFMDEDAGRATLEDLSGSQGAAADRPDGGAGAGASPEPTPPSGSQEEGRATVLEPAEGAADEPSGSGEEPSEELSSVEVDLDAGEDDADEDGEDDDLDRVTDVGDERAEATGAAGSEGEEAEEAADDEPLEELEGSPTVVRPFDLAASEGAATAASEEEAASGEGDAEGAASASTRAAASQGSVGVVVQRVVSVAVGAADPRTTSISLSEERAAARQQADTIPGSELAVEVDDVDEPTVTLSEDSEETSLDELDVEIDESAPAEEEDEEAVSVAADVEEVEDVEDVEEVAASHAAPPELSEQEAAALLEEDAVEERSLEEIEATKRLSKPPPPPPSGAKGAPPPPPEPSKPAPAAAAQAPTAAPPVRRKKGRRKWWEDLFSDEYLRTVPIPHPKTIARQCDFIEQRFGLAPGATILDVGCGLGLHAVELHRRGYLVVGLDLSLPMLSRAADEAQEHGFKINFLHADMRDMNFDGAFDAILCWGTTFGYFDDDGNKEVVDRLYRALKPRGLLLLDVVNRDYVIAGQPNLVWFEGDGCVVMEETKMNYITSRLEVKRTAILDNGRQRDSLYTLRLYALHELGQILHHQGFRVVEVTGREAHPGVFFGADSPKLIILAERRPQGPPSPPSTGSSGAESGAPGRPSDLPAPPAEAKAESSEAEALEEPELTEVEEISAEPSDAVDAAMAETLAESTEIEAVAEELDEDELDEEELDEEELQEEAVAQDEGSSSRRSGGVEESE